MVLCLVGQMALPLMIVTVLGVICERFAAIAEMQVGSVDTAAFVVVNRRNPLWTIAAGTAANIATLHALEATHCLRGH